MYVLEGLRFPAEFPTQPANCRFLVVDEQVRLVKVARHRPLPVVGGYLLGEEVHVVAFREPLGSPAWNSAADRGTVTPRWTWKATMRS